MVPSPFIGKPAPAFRLPQLGRPDATVSDADLKGDISLLNVWATWCAGCREEHMTLMQIAANSGIPIYGLNWKDDADLAERETLAWLAQTVDIDPGPLLEAALSDTVQSVYRANTQEAIDRSVFGSPTYFVEGDMFYGQDHLEMVEKALVKPYAGRWPR